MTSPSSTSSTRTGRGIGCLIVLWLVVGLAPGVGIVLVARAAGGGGEVTCGTQVMEPGDVCQDLGGDGPGAERTYEEQRRLQQGNETVGRWLGFGWMALTGLVALLLALFGDGRRADDPPPPTTP